MMRAVFACRRGRRGSLAKLIGLARKVPDVSAHFVSLTATRLIPKALMRCPRAVSVVVFFFLLISEACTLDAVLSG